MPGAGVVAWPWVISARGTGRGRIDVEAPERAVQALRASGSGRRRRSGRPSPPRWGCGRHGATALRAAASRSRPRLAAAGAHRRGAGPSSSASSTAAEEQRRPGEAHGGIRAGRDGRPCPGPHVPHGRSRAVSRADRGLHSRPMGYAGARTRSMIPVLSALRPAIAELCQLLPRPPAGCVRFRCAGGRFSDRSDIDFAVAFEPDQHAAGLRRVPRFPERPVGSAGRPVDLVIDGAVRNPYLRESMERSRQTVHGA